MVRIGGAELPDALRCRDDRLKVIRAAKAPLEARQRQADEEAARSKDDDGNTRGPMGRSVKRDLGTLETRLRRISPIRSRGS